MAVMVFAAFWACYCSSPCIVFQIPCCSLIYINTLISKWFKVELEDWMRVERGDPASTTPVPGGGAAEALVPSSGKESVSTTLLPFLLLFALTPSGQACRLLSPWPGWNHAVPLASSGLLPTAASAPSLHPHHTFNQTPSFALRAVGKERAKFPSLVSWSKASAARLGSLHLSPSGMLRATPSQKRL